MIFDVIIVIDLSFFSNYLKHGSASGKEHACQF